MWLNMAEGDMDQVVSGIRDQNLKLTLVFGIGMHHAGLAESDRKTVEELFVNQKIQVLIWYMLWWLAGLENTMAYFWSRCW